MKKLDKLLKRSRSVPEGEKVVCHPEIIGKPQAQSNADSEKHKKQVQETGQNDNGHGSGNQKMTPSNRLSITIPNRPEVRTKRLMKEYMQVSHNDESSTFTVELVDDSLYEWNVKLLKIDPDSDLSVDMNETGFSHILLNIIFPDNFPFSPPFMWVVYPRIEGGFVLEGGAICMELLTPSGWSSAYTVEAMIMQFAALVVKGKGRISKKSKHSFSRKDAESTFKKLVKTHEKYGWVTPPQSEG